MDNVQALNQFWNSFGIPAYDVATVPDTAVMPYITYEVRLDFFDEPVATTSSIWYREYSWKAITDKMNEIRNAISSGGKTINYDDGMLWIRPATPFAQRTPVEDDAVRRYIINTYLEFIDDN